MAGEFTITAVNDWRAGVHVDLSRALRVSMDVWRRDGLQATKHMLILMAQSARAMTKQSAKQRKIRRDEHGEYVERWKSGKMLKDYKWRHSTKALERNPRAGTWEQAQIIAGRGLAKRSWMWGLSSLRGDVAGFKGAGAYKPIRGVASGYTINQQRVVGHVLENRLAYLLKIIPANYASAAESKAVSKLLKQAEMKMVRTFERSIGRRAS